MQTADVYTYVNIHFEKFRNDAYEETHKWFKTPEGTRELTIRNIGNKKDLSSILSEKYSEYINVIKSGVDGALNLFSKNNVQFRLFDVHAFADSPGMILLTWEIDNKQYDFAIVGSSQNGPYYKIGMTNGDDFLKGSNSKEYEFNEPLPDWFINGMKTGYC